MSTVFTVVWNVVCMFEDVLKSDKIGLFCKEAACPVTETGVYWKESATAYF